MDFAASLQGFPAFLSHLLMAIVLTVAYGLLYSQFTPHREWALIRQGNVAAAVAFLGSLFGFVLPLATAIRYSTDLYDAALWGLIALVTQVIVFTVLRLLWRDLPARIANNDLAAALVLGGFSLAAGVLSAACMSG